MRVIKEAKLKLVQCKDLMFDEGLGGLREIQPERDESTITIESEVNFY